MEFAALVVLDLDKFSIKFMTHEHSPPRLQVDTAQQDYNYFFPTTSEGSDSRTRSASHQVERSFHTQSSAERSLTHDHSLARRARGTSRVLFHEHFSNKNLTIFPQTGELNETEQMSHWKPEAGSRTSLPLHYQVTRARNELPHGAQEASHGSRTGLLAELWH
jgi:hypothetical protein